jgi:iron(III) transport system substrate-binding protein
MDRLTLGLVASLLLLVACSAAQAPAPPSATGAVGANAPPASAADYRQQVVDAARAEGEVNAAIQTTYTPETIQRLEEAIEREYGVRVRINFSPVGNYPQRAAELFAEQAANARPSYDLYQSSDATSATLRQRDAVETVDWAPLLPVGTPPGMIANGGQHLVIYTDHFGLMSDPTVVSEQDLPRSLKDLSNPRWRGKLMLFQTPTSYLPWVVQIGRDQTLAALRAAVQNGASADTLPGQFTRFAAREYPLIIVTGSFYTAAQRRGIPARFTPLDVSINGDHHVSVARGAAHPNAAKLLAAVLAGPDGQRISGEYVGVGSRYYENTQEQQFEREAADAGFPSFSWQDNPAALDDFLSPAGQDLLREIDQVLKGG